MTEQTEPHGEETGRLTPFYDAGLSYEDNYEKGPFGAFADALEAAGVAARAGSDAAGAAAEPAELFPGVTLATPFGIPAGPLLNARYTRAAFLMGFDIAVYKTVRSRPWPCNDFPNVLAVHPRGRFIDPEGAEKDEGILADRDWGADPAALSISNSFGVPSRDPDDWQPDMARAVAAEGAGQLLIGSFQGTRTPGMGDARYVADCVAAARLVKETGARVIEMNTSCPNEGHDRLLCHDPDLVSRICEAVKDEIGDTPLLIKIAYLPEPAVRRMVETTAARGLVQGICAINTISCRLVDRAGGPALPGAGRERSGVCGAAIRQAGLATVSRLAAARAELSAPFAIVGVGGVMTPADYAAYRDAGADAVLSATGAMWNPLLAREVARGSAA